MKFIDDFISWWRDVGQFIPPCDIANQADREMFKTFAQNVSMQSQSCMAELNAENEQLQSDAEDLRKIENEAIKILDSEPLSSIKKIQKLKELYETQT